MLAPSWMIAALAAPVMLLTTGATRARQAVERAPGTGETHLLSFRAEAVDGVEDLVLRDGRATVEHRQWQPIRGLEIAVRALLPEGDVQVVVRARDGRPRVWVLQQPREENGRELRVRIDDGPASGAAPLSFELWALPWSGAARPCDVLVITIDSLRPDHLGSYGYQRATSPNLDAFARGSVRFTQAFSTSSFTPPAQASLLTSRQVGDHGLLTWNPLPDEQVSLAEVLAEHGFRTGASVNLSLLTQQNLGQGFEWQREGGREARAIVDDALEFVRADDGRPTSCGCTSTTSTGPTDASPAGRIALPSFQAQASATGRSTTTCGPMTCAINAWSRST